MSVLDNIDVRNGMIDSRDIEDRIADLESEIIPDEDGNMGGHPDAECNAELVALRELADEISYAIENQETLIAEWAFEDYARELAEDIGAIPRDAGWPVGYIDWPAAADALKMDYSTVEIDGTDYYYRA